MAKIFISYSHQDKSMVDEIASQIAKAGHDVRRDEQFLKLGDAIAAEIRQEIANSDFTLVFVSRDAAKSEWLAREIHETEYLEFKSKTNKLIPCFLDETAVTDLDVRLGVQVGSDIAVAVKTLLDRFQQGPKGKSEDVTHMVVDHCCPVKSRIESIGWGHRGIRFGSRMAGVPVKRAFFRIA